jgi:glucose/mannose transport system substrate-binding protein
MKVRIALIVIVVMLLGLVGAVVAQDTAPSGELEIYSWWSGDEGPALEALIALFSSKYPDVQMNNATVTGGAGVNFKAVLKTRMLGGDPPDTFQVHAGQELTGTWIIADRMQDLTSLYEEEGWFEAFPQGLIDQLTYEGGIYSVPVNIHRAGVFWYIPANLESWGITVPTTLDEFYAACETLKANDVTPLVVGEAWTLIHLWETVALSVLGADNYDKVWTGGLAPTSPEMIAVWDAYGKVLDCTNVSEDAAGMTWQQATDAVVAGDAAFNVMGDWAAGYLTTTLGLTPGEGYGWADFPGTEGVFMWLSDTFGLPVGAPNPDATIAWLKLLGSVEGQNAFNPLKGSIPARVDAVDAASDLYNAYLQSAAEDWSSNRLVGSLAHGVVANERLMGDFNDVIQIYLQSRSSQAASSAMQAFCAQDGACGM